MFYSYDEALSWLFSQTRDGAPRSLERIKALWKVAGLESPKSCLYVIGTNGKGSVATMLATALKHEGFKVGCFTSPHVSDFRERITLDSELISKENVLDLLNALSKLEPEPKPAFFELSLALALLYFAQEAVDIAVIEAGVGAKLDATNVIANVKATLITNVSLDHQTTLGKNLRVIATDKAEAIRPGTPVFTAARGEALEVILEKAAQLNSLVTIIPPQASHLEENSLVVKACLENLGISPSSIDIGLQDPKLPARLERFNLNGRLIILDGGHNPEAIRALCQSIEGPVIALFSAKHSKDAKTNLGILSQKAKTIFLTSVLGEKPDIDGYPYFAQPKEALDLALADPSGLPIVISGSFYLAGELRPILKRLSKAINPIAA